MSDKRFILYRIYYDETIVYVGRTKQPLPSRIYGHLFQKPVQRSICYSLVSRIEYAELPTEADMNLYEIYYILILHPPLNVDDKTKDTPTVSLPELEWKEWTTPLWDKWGVKWKKEEELRVQGSLRLRQIPQDIRVIKSEIRMGTLRQEDGYARIDQLREESYNLRKKMYGTF